LELYKHTGVTNIKQCRNTRKPNKIWISQYFFSFLGGVPAKSLYGQFFLEGWLAVGSCAI
jgi:hypothetical protein